MWVPDPMLWNRLNFELGQSHIRTPSHSTLSFVSCLDVCKSQGMGQSLPGLPLNPSNFFPACAQHANPACLRLLQVGRGIDIERVNIVINYDMPETDDVSDIGLEYTC